MNNLKREIELKAAIIAKQDEILFSDLKSYAKERAKKQLNELKTELIELQNASSAQLICETCGHTVFNIMRDYSVICPNCNHVQIVKFGVNK